MSSKPLRPASTKKPYFGLSSAKETELVSSLLKSLDVRFYTVQTAPLTEKGLAIQIPLCQHTEPRTQLS